MEKKYNLERHIVPGIQVGNWTGETGQLKLKTA